jgi:hypothetical protein
MSLKRVVSSNVVIKRFYRIFLNWQQSCILLTGRKKNISKGGIYEKKIEKTEAGDNAYKGLNVCLVPLTHHPSHSGLDVF